MPKSISHLAVGCFHNLFPTLVLSPIPPHDGEPLLSASELRADIEVFNCFGQLHSNATLILEQHKVGLLDLEPLITSLPLERGLQYGQIRLTTDYQNKSVLCWRNQFFSEITNNSLLIKAREPIFFPFYLSQSQEHLLLLINPTQETVSYTAKLFAGQRSPDISRDIGPMKSEVLSIAHEFQNKLGNLDASSVLQSYLRISINQSGSLIANVIQSDSDSFLRIMS